MPLGVSEDGEAANTEIDLLLGLTGRLLTGPLGDRLPALAAVPRAAASVGAAPSTTPTRTRRAQRPRRWSSWSPMSPPLSSDIGRGTSGVQLPDGVRGVGEQ